MKQYWNKEYKSDKNFPSSRTYYPSKSLVWFLKEYPDLEGNALDVGCGNGRNSIFLAQNGFHVVGVEISDYAIEVAKETVKEKKLSSKIQFVEQSAGEKFGFENESFDLIIDMMTMHLLTKNERDIYAKEVARLLKPNGYFLFHTIAAESPEAKRLFEESPGPEKNAYVIPQTGIVEKGFTEKYLKRLFAPLSLQSIQKNGMYTPAFGDVFQREYYSGVFQKI